MPWKVLPLKDRQEVLARSENLFSQIEGAKVFVTGATGLFGRWMVECLLHAIDERKLSSRLTLLVRDPARWELSHPSLELHEGDVRDFIFPKGKFTDIVHFATPASVQLNKKRPLEMWDTIVTGMKHTLEFARSSGVKRVLFSSSGAVYGEQPANISHLCEESRGNSDPLRAGSAYAEGKRAAEFLCAEYYRTYGIETKIARCFAVLGPLLPQGTHFAAGNFIGNALRKETIQIEGDGTPYRSYLYMTDLCHWLLKIWIEGKPALPYNVGSEKEISIRELAETIASISGTSVKIAKDADPSKLPPRYIPSTKRARTELGLQENFSLKEMIQRTLQWYEANG